MAYIAVNNGSLGSYNVEVVTFPDGGGAQVVSASVHPRTPVPPNANADVDIPLTVGVLKTLNVPSLSGSPARKATVRLIGGRGYYRHGNPQPTTSTGIPLLDGEAIESQNPSLFAFMPSAVTPGSTDAFALHLEFYDER